MKKDASQNSTTEDLKAKPVLKWAGGKFGLMPQLVQFFPKEFKRYFEPFLGGGAVFFSLGFKGQSHLNDANPELIEVYESVRDFPYELMSELESLQQKYGEDFYYLLRSQMPHSKILRAARTIFLNKTCFNGLYRQNSKGEFNVPFGKRKNCPALYQKENLLRVSRLLRCASLTSYDFEAIIDLANKGDFVYCDPPYEPISPTASFNAYRSQGFSQEEQVRLKQACLRAQQRGAYVVISNSSADFIQQLYNDCQVAKISARRSINSKADGRGVLYELAAVMHPEEF